MPDLTKVTSTNLVSYTELLSFEGALSLASAIGEVGEGLINNIDDGLNEDDANRTRGAIVLVTHAARSLACFFQQVHVENLNKTWGHHE